MGVFITKGMQVGVPPGGLVFRMGPDGKPTGSLTIHVALEVAPYWLDLAIGHSVVAEDHRSSLMAAWREQVQQEVTIHLEAEFLASMQACMSSAIAVDAFYASIRDHVPLPKEVVASWRRNRTARYRQVAEVLKRGFKVRRDAQPAVRRFLKDLYRMRDAAVHPDSRLRAPIPHPALGVATEWRFVYFRVENAKALISGVLTLIRQLLPIPRTSRGALAHRCEPLRGPLSELCAKWESHFGPLAPRPDPEAQVE
jgi:hypothetical protein